jgi:serine/threonine protein kinase
MLMNNIAREVGEKVPMVDETNLPENRAFEYSGVRYVLGHQIAKGGFSTVYKARDEWGNSLAAKISNPGVSLGMWNNEVHNLLRLRHPNIIYMHTAFERNGRGHIILEHAGIGIGRVQVGAQNERQILLKLAAKCMLEALHFMHSKGYVHTDMNPGNGLLLLTPDNKPVTVKICDLGLSCKASDLVRGRHTAKWNPPPENYDARFGDLSPAMDVYSTALVLMELLLGEELCRFTDEEICAGAPQRMALEMSDPLGVALASALNPKVSERVTAIELWRRIRQASKVG